MSNRPTRAQNDILEFIDNFIKNNGYGPSYREIMAALNLKSVSTVAVHVDNLIKLGRLAKTDRSARSLVVLDEQTDLATTDKDVQPGKVWLVAQVDKRLAEYKNQPTNNKRAELQILIQALRLLNLPREAARVEAELNTQALV